MKSTVKKITEALILINIGKLPYMNRVAPSLNYVSQAPSFFINSFKV